MYRHACTAPRSLHICVYIDLDLVTKTCLSKHIKKKSSRQLVSFYVCVYICVLFVGVFALLFSLS